MALTVNGDKYTRKTPLGLKELLVDLKVNPRRAAVVVNDEVVQRAKQAGFILNDGDRVVFLNLAVGG